MEEPVYGVLKPATVLRFQQVIQGLKDQGCDAVILGCTEIPSSSTTTTRYQPWIRTSPLGKGRIAEGCERGDAQLVVQPKLNGWPPGRAAGTRYIVCGPGLASSVIARLTLR